MHAPHTWTMPTLARGIDAIQPQRVLVEEDGEDEERLATWYVLAPRCRRESTLRA